MSSKGVLITRALMVLLFLLSEGNLPLRPSECVTPLCVCVCSHLQVPDELSHGDLLRHSVVEAVAVEHHALQDGERALQNGHVHHGLVHVACNLSGDRAADVGTSFSVPGAKCFWNSRSFMSSVFVPESCSYTLNNVRIIWAVSWQQHPLTSSRKRAIKDE